MDKEDIRLALNAAIEKIKEQDQAIDHLQCRRSSNDFASIILKGCSDLDLVVHYSIAHKN